MSKLDRQRQRLRDIRDVTIKAWWDIKSEDDTSPALLEQIDRLHCACDQELVLLFRMTGE
jgi:hypothetical protein|tara:strand:+ start:399 stop:578 length:180 start_codon:yes stop_codon:yes gene_type:complete